MQHSVQLVFPPVGLDLPPEAAVLSGVLIANDEALVFQVAEGVGWTWRGRARPGGASRG